MTRRTRDIPLAAVLLLPALGVLGMFALYPMVHAIVLGLYRYPRGGMPEFAGPRNYLDLIQDPAFTDSVLVTGYYAAGTIVPSMALSFVLADALFRVKRLRSLLRTIFFLPYVTAVVASALIWRTLFEPSSGVINALLGWAGIEGQAWLLEPRGVLNVLTGGWVDPSIGPSLALCCVIVFEIWRTTGFMTVLMLSGLASIPREYEEAARIDGAGGWRIARHVTLPLLSPVLFFLGIVSLIGSLQAFSSIYALTGGGSGPLNSTRTLTVFIFANFYEYQKIGYGSAAATLLCAGIALLTFVQWRLTRRRVHYS